MRSTLFEWIVDAVIMEEINDAFWTSFGWTRGSRMECCVATSGRGAALSPHSLSQHVAVILLVRGRRHCPWRRSRQAMASAEQRRRPSDGVGRACSTSLLGGQQQSDIRLPAAHPAAFNCGRRTGAPLTRSNISGEPRPGMSCRRGRRAALSPGGRGAVPAPVARGLAPRRTAVFVWKDERIAAHA